MVSVSCNGVCDGSITITNTVGIAPFSYAWDDGAAGDTRDNLCAGDYIVTTTDGNGCTDVDTIEITEPLPLVVDILNPTDASCSNTCDGTATVNVTNGTPPFNYQWSNGEVTANPMMLCVGTNTITITDANGCTIEDSVTIGGPPVITISFTNVVNPGCGLSDGSIEAVASGGSGGFTYSWNNSQVSATAVNLPAGVYTVTVTDANGCSNSAIFPLNNSGGILPAISTTSTDAACDSSCTGTANVLLPTTGGPFSIQWSTDPNDTTSSIANVCPGIVSVTVTDVLNGCTAVDTVSIRVPDGIVANLTSTDNTPCDGNCTGSLTTNVLTGTGPFTYVWSIPGESGPTVSSLCGGTYTVTITSADGCEVILTEDIQDNSALSSTVDAVVDASCPTSTDGSISISVSGGNTPYSYSWSGQNFSSSAEDIANLLPGEYRLTVSDASGCELFDTILVDTLNSVTVSASDTLVCSGVNDVVLRASVQTNASVITYQWFAGNGLPLGTDSTQAVSITNGGDTNFYAVQVVADGCIAFDTSRVISVISPTANAGPDTGIVIGASVVLGGAPTTDDDLASILWFPGTTLDDSRTANPEASPRATVTYTVEVTNDEGCVGTDQVTVTVDTEFEYPDGFTPNNDGTNDTWELDFLANYLDCSVQVFNRWGVIVFESDGYTEPWDGTMDGEELPIGTYYYIIDLGDEGISEPLTGPISILR